MERPRCLLGCFAYCELNATKRVTRVRPDN
jgi:hypothetical protein